MFSLFTILAIFILLLFSAFFSSSETGLTAVSRAKIHKLASEGSKRAKLVEKIREDKEALIGALLLGNNAVNILASALATSVAINLVGDGGVFYATIIMTLLVLIFAEVLPKTYAFHNAEKLSLLFSPVIRVVVILFNPITKMVQWLVSHLMRFFGIIHKEELVSASDALRGAIELHHHEGDVVKEDKDMLGGVLDLAQMEVGDIMVHRRNITSLNAELPVKEIIDKALQSHYSRIPLWKEKPENITAILHVKSLLQAMKKQDYQLNKIHLDDITSDPWFVPESNTLQNQLSQFRAKRTHMAIVVDEYGDLEGLVTLEDILEEIVGQIEDEYDTFDNDIEHHKDGHYTIPGNISIRDLNRALNLTLPEEHASTLAGLIIHEAEKIPVTEETLEIYGLRITVKKKQKNRITLVDVRTEE